MNVSSLPSGRACRELDVSDDINDHTLYLHSDRPEEVLDNLESQDAKARRMTISRRTLVHTSLVPPELTAEEAEAAEEAARAREVREARASQARERLRQGEVIDFRGPPAVDIYTLSCPAAEPAPPRRPPDEEEDFLTQLSQDEHTRSAVLDEGDFRAITRCDPGYYDWTINPSTLADAPREMAIRGNAGAGDVALVTSLGLGHLRGRQKGQQPAPTAGEGAVPASASSAAVVAYPQVPTRPVTDRVSKSPKSKARHERGPRRPFARASDRTQSHDGKQSKVEAIPSPESPPPRPLAAAQPQRSPPPQVVHLPPAQQPPSQDPAHLAAHRKSIFASEGSPRKSVVASARKSMLASSGTFASEAASGEAVGETSSRATLTAATGLVVLTEQAQAQDDSSDEEPWRSKRVGRGVPDSAREAKPRSQKTAGGEDDVAVMLKERGDLTEAPEPPEVNFLSRLHSRKAEWLYYHPESSQTAGRRTALPMEQSKEVARATWTSTGRFVSAQDIAPRRAFPRRAERQSDHMRLRTPMTRGEVTEQRLIEAAMRPPAEPEKLVLRTHGVVRDGRPTPPPGGRSSTQCTSRASAASGAAGTGVHSSSWNSAAAARSSQQPLMEFTVRHSSGLGRPPRAGSLSAR